MYYNLIMSARYRDIFVAGELHQIKALEKRLGVMLFVRDPRLLTLTAAGHGLFHEIDPLIRSIESSVKRYSRSSDAVKVTTLNT